MHEPLRYHISDLRQLRACRSNKSQALKIVVTSFIQDPRLEGTRVQVVHDTFGVLFAYVFHAQGDLIESYGEIDEMRIKQLLRELKKYGFIVYYDPVKHLPEAQIEFLTTINGLGFDKIRVLSIYKDSTMSEDDFISNVTLFNVEKNPKWLDSRYCTTQDEYNKALNEGSAFNVSSISQAKKFDWTWLCGFVADIEDVLKDNEGTLERYSVE